MDRRSPDVAGAGSQKVVHSKEIGMKKAQVYSTTRLTESYWPADTSRELLESTVGDVLRQVADEVPDRLALVEGVPDHGKRRRWTYAQLLADAERVASALLGRFKPGEHVAVWADNIPEWVLLEYGCAIAGIVVVTVNPAYRARELEYTLKQSDAVGLFVINEYRGHNTLEIAQQAQKNLPSLREIVCFSDFDAFMNSGSKSVTLPDVKPHDPFMIIYTSGTTGAQKGVLVRHTARLNSDYFVAERAGLEVGGVWINPMPMFHNAGCAVVTLGSLMQSGTHVLASGFDPALILDLFEKENGTFSLLVPTMLEAILAFPDRKKYDLSTWKNVMTGAAFVEVKLVDRIHKELGLGVSIVFGQTESQGCVCGTHRDDSVEDQSATIGQPLPQCEVKIADSKTGKVLPLNEVGEICIRGFQSVTEYYKMPEATALAVTSDGWLRTGRSGLHGRTGLP